MYASSIRCVNCAPPAAPSSAPANWSRRKGFYLCSVDKCKGCLDKGCARTWTPTRRREPLPFEVQFHWRQGNTIPYPPTRRGGRTNAGFFDLRDRPEKVKEIHETQQSPALAAFLREIARHPALMSLGCDIGAHEERHGRRTRQYAGGYVQITYRDLDIEDDVYDSLAARIADHVEPQAGRSDWWLGLDVSQIRYRLDSAVAEPYSLSMWFLASAPTQARAIARRERLIRTIRAGLFNAVSGLSEAAQWATPQNLIAPSDRAPALVQ